MLLTLAATLAGCGSSESNTGNVGPTPQGPSLSEALGAFRTIEHGATIRLRTDVQTVLATQISSDSFGPVIRQSLGLPWSQASIRAFGIGNGGDLPLISATTVTATDRSDLLALAACIPTTASPAPAQLDLATAISPMRAGLANGTRWTADGGVFRANATLQHGNGESWYLLDDGLGTVVQCDRAMRPVRAVRFDGFGLANARISPLLLGPARAFVVSGVRTADGALYHLVVGENGSTLRSQTFAGLDTGTIVAAASESYLLEQGCYATRHHLQPEQGAARTVLCVFGPDHVPLSIVENGTTQDVTFLPVGSAFTAAPICTASNQWQPVQVALQPDFPVDATGFHGKVDAHGTVLLSTDAAQGRSVVSCLNTEFIHRWSVDLLATEWNLLAASSSAVLLVNQTAIQGLLGVVLLDRGNGAILASNYFAAPAGSTLSAEFANDGLSFVLAAQSVATRFAVLAYPTQPLRAFVAETLNPIAVGSVTHDPATDLFTLPLVDGRTLFAAASALGTSATSLLCLPTDTVEALAMPANPFAMAVTTTSLPSLPKLPRALAAPQALPLTGTAVRVELLTTDAPVQPICR